MSYSTSKIAAYSPLRCVFHITLHKGILYIIPINKIRLYQDRQCSINVTLQRVRLTVDVLHNSITYSECASVALFILHAIRMRHIILSSVAYLAVPYCSTSSVAYHAVPNCSTSSVAYLAVPCCSTSSVAYLAVPNCSTSSHQRQNLKKLNTECLFIFPPIFVRNFSQSQNIFSKILT